MLTLADILAQQDFKLRLLTGDDQALRRRIAGAHNSEMTRPAEFLPPEWLLLTLGMTLGEGKQQQQGLIASLDDAGISALGFGVELRSRRFPTRCSTRRDDEGSPFSRSLTQRHIGRSSGSSIDRS